MERIEWILNTVLLSLKSLIWVVLLRTFHLRYNIHSVSKMLFIQHAIDIRVVWASHGERGVFKVLWNPSGWKQLYLIWDVYHYYYYAFLHYFINRIITVKCLLNCTSEWWKSSYWRQYHSALEKLSFTPWRAIIH